MGDQSKISSARRLQGGRSQAQLRVGPDVETWQLSGVIRLAYPLTGFGGPGRREDRQ